MIIKLSIEGRKTGLFESTKYFEFYLTFNTSADWRTIIGIGNPSPRDSSLKNSNILRERVKYVWIFKTQILLSDGFYFLYQFVCCWDAAIVFHQSPKMKDQ